MNYSSIIQFIGGSAIAIAAVTYLAKRFIDKSLDAAVERYKLNLQQELELYKHNLAQESERLKFELNKISLEHQIRYNSLYLDRGTVIKQIYSELIKLEDELRDLTTIFQVSDWIKTENNFKIRDLIVQFERQFEEKRLFFSEELCNEIELLIERMRTINQRMYSAKLQEETNKDLIKLGQPVTTEELLNPKTTWRALEIQANNELKKVRRALERSFAKLIGVE